MDREIQDTQDVQPEAEQLTSEQAADLAFLAQSIADEPAPQAEAEAEPVQQVTVSQTAEISGILFTVGQLAGMKFAALRDIYTKARCDEVAEAVAPVFADLRWNVTGGKAGMYITAFLAVFMLGNDTRQAIKAELVELVKQQGAVGAN